MLQINALPRENTYLEKTPPSNKRPLFSHIIFKGNGSEDGLIHCFKEGEPCQNGREQLISQLNVLDEPDRPNPFDLITDSDVDEADNAVFQIEEDYEIIDVDI